MTDEERVAEVRRLLAEDDVYFCRNALQIVTKSGRLVPFEPRPAQVRLFEALRRQRDAGLPERVIILKARQIGFSTATQGTLIRRVTQRRNHRALVVAHDNDTAGSLFEIGALMIAHLPSEIRPEIESQRNALGQKYLKFGRRSVQQRMEGDLGLNSLIQIDTAKEADGGRGHTRHSMHLSEVAFWEQIGKLTGLLNSVPDEPGTLIVLESTANGMNAFEQAWRAAVNGASGYYPFFSAWHEEEAYRLGFGSEEAREEFIASIGDSRQPFGEDEPRLVEDFGCTPEQLQWRRRTIVARCEGKLERWNAEYPASPEDAFVATGKTVFSQTYVKRVIARTARTDLAAVEGTFVAGQTRLHLIGGERRPVPASALWVPKAPDVEAPGWWRLWSRPHGESSVPAERERFSRAEITLEEFDARLAGLLSADGGEVVVPAGAYVLFVDPASGAEVAGGDSDYHSIQVIDHRTLEQVAEFHSRCDADQLAEQALLAGYYFNEGLIAVEITGGYGTPIAKDYLHRRFGYRRLYRRTPAQSVGDRPETILGWDTNRRTKPELIAGMAELFREGNDGIRSAATARQFLTFVRDEAGRTGASHGHHDDRVMAYMGAQQVARIHRPPRSRSAGSGPSVSTVAPRNQKTGY